MGSTQSKNGKYSRSCRDKRRKPASIVEDVLEVKPAHQADGFGVPWTDPAAKDDSARFPLDGREFTDVADGELAALFSTAPVLFQLGGRRIVRLSRSLVMKGGANVKPSEAATMSLAATTLHLPTPQVHRVFRRRLRMVVEHDDEDVCCIVMDYVGGPTVEECWPVLSQQEKEDVAMQVAVIIDRMQATPVIDIGVGPVDWRKDKTEVLHNHQNKDQNEDQNMHERFQGPWFSGYGAGPFDTLQDLEDWCNHKIDVGLRFRQTPADTPRFSFQAAKIVLTHQDVAPRNMIRDAAGRVWLLDWGFGGIYPRGFEHAVLEDQARNRAFSDMVFARLSEQHEQMRKQRRNLAFGLTTGALL